MVMFRQHASGGYRLRRADLPEAVCKERDRVEVSLRLARRRWVVVGDEGGVGRCHQRPRAPALVARALADGLGNDDDYDLAAGTGILNGCWADEVEQQERREQCVLLGENTLGVSPA